MMTSILLVDVQGLETRVGGGLAPADLLADLTHTMHGMSRQIMVQRAYCSSRISAYRRNAYRDAGYQIVETAGPDETLIMMTLDLADLSGGNAVYEEAILLGGTADYTALARLAHENLMMISVMDHPTISASLEALADGLIDPDELPVSETPSILDRSDSKRQDSKLEETPRKSPFLAPLPESSILKPTAPTAKAEAVEPEVEAEADDATPKTSGEPESDIAPNGELKTEDTGESEDTNSGDADESGDDEKSGDAWPDPKTGPILVAGGSIAEAVGLATALDDPEEKPTTTASEESTSTPTTDPVEAELADEIASELSVSAEEIGTDPNEPAGTVLIDLQIEDLVADEFTQTPADQPSPALAAADDTAPSDAPAEEDDPLDALFADMGADLTPDSPEAASAANPLDSLDIAPEDLLEDLDPLEPISLEKTADSADENATSAEEPAAETKKASSKDLSEEVDELLSRLMSDGSSSGAPTEDVKLDVVPER